MKRSIARKWSKALESGEYKQGFGRLRKGDKFCCLAVLCNLHAQEHPEIAVKNKLKSTYMGETSVLPLSVIKWAGMHSDVGFITYGKTLATMNDKEGKSFEELAKVIRKNWKKL